MKLSPLPNKPIALDLPRSVNSDLSALPASLNPDRPPDRALLSHYRAHFAATGISLPLRTLTVPSSGLLATLPSGFGGQHGWPWTNQARVPQCLPAKIPTISIVVPSFNQGKYIEEALRSILLQNYPALELIVVDGGSTDQTQEILEQYRPWISFVRSGPDRGQGHALNLGFALASGDVIGWLNSDDAYFPEALQRVGRSFAEDDELDFFYGDSVYLAESEQKVYYSSAPLALDRYLHFGGLVPTHAAFWRHVITQPIWEAMKCNVDGELWFRLLRGARRRHLPVPLGALRGQAEAKSMHSRWRAAWHEDEKLIWAMHGNPPKSGSLRSFEYRQVQRLYAKWVKKRWANERAHALAQTNWKIS